MAHTRKKTPRGSGLTSIAGAMLVGFDEQVLRTLPRSELLVQRGKTVRGLSAQGGTLIVGLPDDPIELPARPPGDEDDDFPRSRARVSSP